MRPSAFLEQRRWSTLPTEDERARGPVDGLELLRAQSRSARSAIFQAKLRPAANPSYLLRRPRLLTLLDESVAAPLTLVVAPAGSGKTSLLRSWARETTLPLAWLSIDEDDRDPVQLWRALLAALEGIAPGCAAAAADPIRRPGRLLEGVGALLDDLESRDYPAKVLVLDDLQLVDEEDAVAPSLALFVQHLPAWLHVVVASRHAPRLPVHRLRARGQLGEVHFAELRFSHEEASAMLSRLAPSLDRDVVAEVAARAGGWAASIQLAALAKRASRAQGAGELPNHDDDALYLEDYIWQEVLAGERQELVDVLLATTVVKTVDPGLAQVLTGRPDAADLLAEAEARSLFISRIEPSGAFEMHALVREVLLGVLGRRAVERPAQLHALAARWHEAHGQTVSALEHWLRAGMPRSALRLLAREALALADGGHEGTIRRTLEAIPDQVGTADVTSTLELAWSHLFVDRSRFLRLVDYLAIRTEEAVDIDQVLVARLGVLRTLAAIVRGSWDEGAAQARAAATELGETWWLDPLGRFAWDLVAREVVLAECWDDNAPDPRSIVEAVAVSPDRRISLEGTRALGEALAGRPADALRLAGGARRASELTNMTTVRAELAVAEALAHRELGDAAVAVPKLVGLAETRIEQAPWVQLLAGLELTLARVDEANLEAAASAFGLAAELVDTEMPGASARSWLARTGVQLSLAGGELDEASAWAAQVDDAFWSGVTVARLRLVSGERGLAVDALKAAEPRSVRHRVVGDLLRFRAASAPDEAEAFLLDAVALASAHSLVQTVASEGPEVVDAVERLAWHAPEAWLASVRRALVPGGPVEDDPTPDLVEALTERELEVLRMLPSRLTLREIADELFISINTLKFHLRVIYRKLGCGSRSEAAELARSMTSLRRRSQSPLITRRR